MFMQSGKQYAPQVASGKQRIFIHDQELDKGGYPQECPFNTSRAGKTCKLSQNMGLFDEPDRCQALPVALTREELESFHTPAYLDALQAAQEGKHDLAALAMGLGTADCPLFPGMYDYVRLAAGGTLTGARLILQGEADIVFNPSGGFHHAAAGSAAGFCYVNDVVIAADELARAGKRVLVLDIDVHHCEGVQEAFYERADVMTVSMHEGGKGFFPGTGFEDEIGTGPGEGFTANLPLPRGTHDAIYQEAFGETVLPLLRAFDPDVILLELGMDTLAGDPLAHLRLTNNTPADCLDLVLALGKPILATGGGGYNVPNTVRAWTLCWSVLCGDDQLHQELMIGMGGSMLQNTDWAGGLRDPARTMELDGRVEIDAEVRRVAAAIRAALFPRFGLK